MSLTEAAKTMKEGRQDSALEKILNGQKSILSDVSRVEDRLGRILSNAFGPEPEEESLDAEKIEEPVGKLAELHRIGISIEGILDRIEAKLTKIETIV